MSTEEVKMERIYIGGLDPPQLRPSDVQKRLKSLDGIKIISVAMDDSKTFYHITARPLKYDDITALAIVSKNYNNVKWKGCKLSVKGARPHFLDKLRKEFADRQPIAKSEVVDTTTTTPEDSKTPTVVPRRLRIRQKYGEEAHRVDTKPCETTDWTSFTKIVSKMRQRRERKSKGTKEDKTVSFYNRAVHMSFNDDGTAEAPPPPPLVDDNAEASSGSKFVKSEKAKQNADSDESDDSDSDASDEKRPLKSKFYAWSSDEGDSDEEADAAPSKPDKIIAVAAADSDVVASKVTIVAVANSEDNGQYQIEEHLSKEPSKKALPKNDESNGYEWSSDEDGSEEEIEFRTVKAEQEPVSEFASAINFDEDDEEESDDDDVFPGTAVELDGLTEDLEKDVMTNLDVLSQLFPDLKQNVPRQIDPVEAEGVKPKWATPTMQRYDPTKESAQQFEIKKDSADEESEASDSDSSSSSDDNDDDDRTATKPVEESVYHEAKLEEVFRSARDTGEAGGFQVSSMFGEQPDELKEKEKMAKPEEAPTGAFSFNFELAAVPASEENVSDDSKFSFGSDVADPADSVAKTVETESKKEDEVMASAVDEAPQSEPQPEETEPLRPRRRGFLPPSEVVDEFYNKFFELNDGDAIQDNPGGFRNNEDVKAEWKQERYTLTQDWKRKRKYAQSRLQKKYKFR